MKKALLIGLIIVLCSASAYVYLTPKNESDQQFIFDSGFKNIPEFKDWVKDDSRQKWANKGYHYLSFAEMDTLCKLNGFILSRPENYISTIPDSIKTVIRDNYKKLEDYELKWYIESSYSTVYPLNPGLFSDNEIAWMARDDGDHSDAAFFPRLGFWVSDAALDEQNMNKNHKRWEIKRNYDNSGLFIVAHHSKFSSDTEAEEHILKMPQVNPDPMVVMKQRKGWVVLAYWE